ncbi:hypothetical protein M9Y10_020511 [Tritrichomonas musculus]|uniref:DUF3447 domain-containing protein n=1 Tax=Tritrichomonas musculus TaxID=1915356 RepID=A0ABR2HGG8_9EUKA
MKDVEENLLIFLEKQDFNEFNDYLQNQKISENKYELKSFLYLIVAISNHHYRTQQFFTKIEQIIKSLQEKIQYFFSNFEIFRIFQASKRILLFLFKLKIITPTEDIYYVINTKDKYINRNYLEYFYLEFEQYMDEKTKSSIQIPKIIDEFNEKRENGENDNYICQLIRNDLVIDFIKYINKENISPSTQILRSIYETNLFLTNHLPSLIEYSAFYGSIQIFRYLYYQNVEISTSIWPFAVHGRNAEIIHFLEEKKVKTLSNTYQYLVIETIKCHHKELTDYFLSNFCGNEKIYDYYLYRKSLKYYNFSFFSNKSVCSLIDSCKANPELNILYYLCKYDYNIMVEFILTRYKGIDVNYEHNIYKPFSISLLDIVICIEVKNGDLSNISKIEEEEDPDEYMLRYYKRIKDNMKYIEYKYDQEISPILHIAIRKGNIDLIQFLFTIPRIDINSRSTKISKELKYESCNDYYIIKEKMSLLNEAIESGYTDVVQILLNDKSFDVNNRLLMKKQFENCFSTAHPIYIERREETSLQQAIKRENINIVKLLLSNPIINVNLKSSSVIHESGGCYVFVSTDKYIEKSSLFFAINSENNKNKLELIKLLLSISNIDVNFGIKEYLSEFEEDRKLLQEKSTLYLAVENENLEIIQLLLEQPLIDIDFLCTLYDIKDHKKLMQKKTALNLATEIKNNEIVQLLNK